MAPPETAAVALPVDTTARDEARHARHAITFPVKINASFWEALSCAEPSGQGRGPREEPPLLCSSSFCPLRAGSRSFVARAWVLARAAGALAPARAPAARAPVCARTRVVKAQLASLVAFRSAGSARAWNVLDPAVPAPRAPPPPARSQGPTVHARRSDNSQASNRWSLRGCSARAARVLSRVTARGPALF